MQDVLHLTPTENVWLATYAKTNDDSSDGMICLEANIKYTLPVLTRMLDVSAYTAENELMVKTEDVALAVHAGKIKVDLEEETHIERGYN